MRKTLLVPNAEILASQFLGFSPLVGGLLHGPLLLTVKDAQLHYVHQLHRGYFNNNVV